MFEFINHILLCFRSCFSRKAAFDWFVIVIIGLLVRSDCLGVTSIIRDLAILPSLYPCLLHFFRADSWDEGVLFSTWANIVAHRAPLKKISCRTVLIGDGVKRACDGRFMPCVKKMTQESENANKPQYILGHFFGAVGVLIGSATKSFCLPLSIRFHDGDQAVFGWWKEQVPSHGIQMLENGIRASQYFGNSLFVLDR